MYKAERNTYKFTVYNFSNLTINTFGACTKLKNKMFTATLKLILNAIAKYLLFGKDLN